MCIRDRARLKNCGQLKKEGIVFHPKSPYYSVCADVMLINAPNVVGEHTHNINTVSSTRKNLKLGDATDLKDISIGNQK